MGHLSLSTTKGHKKTALRAALNYGALLKGPIER